MPNSRSIDRRVATRDGSGQLLTSDSFSISDPLPDNVEFSGNAS
ncbi:MAG: hypothetical protein AAGA75_06860 [Cyanobacteria bacterium P01_E01_bin.6]